MTGLRERSIVTTRPDTVRPRVLLGAYACEPGRGSEPGAGWTWARAAARHHDVWVLTHETNRTSVEKALADDPDLARAIHPVFLQNPRRLRPLRRGPSRFLYYLYWQTVVCPRASRMLHRTVGFDLCHHVTYASDWLPAGVATLPDVPFVWGPVGGASTSGGFRLWKLLGARTVVREAVRSVFLGAAQRVVGRRTGRRSALVLGQNDDVRRAFPDARVVVQPNVALEGALRPADDAPARASRPTAVFAGRLLAWKGVRLALLALRRPSGRHWRLEIFGDGPERARLEDLTLRWGLTDRVRFAGQRPRAEVLDAIRAADLLLAPSVHDAAGWSVAEAAALGCPVVALGIGGPRSILRPEDGVLVDVDAADVVGELARALDIAAAKRPGVSPWYADRLPEVIRGLYAEVTTVGALDSGRADR